MANVFFGVPNNQITVEKFEDEFYHDYIEKIVADVDKVLENSKDVTIEELEENNTRPIYEIDDGYFHFMAEKFREGKFDLRLVGGIANIIFFKFKSL
ncbi:hypothetical protein [Geomicrobium sp. JCM 19055]|uniref:hypothetical protein n=1 Tax=Geomicrobium sp. JCM 19055 TaxID=1460649 RepID=UPI0005A61689|nr:hypothetical protein [Geomicrobium sp. JCM 19055]